MPEEVAVQIVTTVAEKATAVSLAHHLLRERLVGCVQIDGPVESLYRWEDEIEQATEWRLTIKTTSAATEPTIAAIQSQHPYEVPEILVLPVSGGSPSYLRWLVDEVTPAEEP